MHTLPSDTIVFISSLLKRHVAHIFCFSAFVLGQQSHAGGVAAIKNQPFHDDSIAKPFVYDNKYSTGAPFVKFERGGKSRLINKENIAGTVEVPNSLPSFIASETEIQLLKTSLKELKDFTVKFQQTRTLLGNRIIKLEEYVKKVDSGFIMTNGEWVLRTASTAKASEDYKNESVVPSKPTDSEGVFEFQTLDGTKFMCTKTRAGESGVTVVHSEGVTLIDWDNVSEDEKSKLGYQEIIDRKKTRELAAVNEVNNAITEFESIKRLLATPMQDVQAQAMWQKFYTIKSKLNVTSSDVEDIKKVYGAPNSTGNTKIKNDIATIGNRALGNDEEVFDNVALWNYNNRLLNPITEAYDTLTVLVNLDRNMSFLGILSADKTKYLSIKY